LRELENDRTPFVKAAPVMDLDTLPFPDWEQIEPDSYPPAPHGVFAKASPIAQVISSRGCPYPCVFCASPRFYDRQIRFRSPQNIVGEIEMLVDKFGVKEIQFEDDNLTLNRNHIEGVCRLIIEKNIKAAFSCPNGIRADKIDDELAKLMRQAGFYYCALGIESADKTILKNIKKSETIETITSAVQILKKNGFVVMGFFILGLPGETKETIQKTIRYTIDVGLDRALFSIFEMFPGCELWTTLRGKFKIHFNGGSLSEASYVPEGLSAVDLQKAQSAATRKFYLRLSVLLKTLPYFRPRTIIYLLRNMTIFGLIRLKRKEKTC
jgi:radical SAM superfamily enzyme YgiQ (UPF0313 family)